MIVKLNKQIFLFLSLIYMLLSCDEKSVHQSVDENKISHIDSCYEFYNNFPSSFNEFDELYGFDDNSGEKMPLYDVYEENITKFFNCESPPDSLKLKKAINIGVGGRWDADAVSLFKRKTFILIKRNPETTLKILNSLTDEESSSFWYYLFDGPIPENRFNEQNIDTLYILFGKQNKQSKLLREQFEALKKKDIIN